MENSLSRYALATASLAAVAIPAAAKADFSGPYAPANWTFQNTGGSTNGSVDTSGAPASITLTGGSSQSGVAGDDTNFTIAAVASGMVSFDWNYSSSDSSSYDTGNFLLNGSPTFLANNNGGSGFFSIAVTSGNVFGSTCTVRTTCLVPVYSRSQASARRCRKAVLCRYSRSVPLE